MSIFIRPRIESTSTYDTGCTLSAAIACGLASSLYNISPLFISLETNHSQLSIGGYSQRNNLHAPQNSARSSRRSWSRAITSHPSVVLRSVLRCVCPLPGSQTLPDNSAGLVLVADTI